MLSFCRVILLVFLNNEINLKLDTNCAMYCGTCVTIAHRNSPFNALKKFEICIQHALLHVSIAQDIIRQDFCNEIVKSTSPVQRGDNTQSSKVQYFNV